MASNCTSGCPTKDHRSYGECLRDKGAKVAYCNSAGGQDYTKQKKWDAELDAYRDARRQGIQPSGTTMAAVERAVAISDKTGHAYDAGA